MKVKINLIVLLFLCTIMIGCTKEYDLTLDKGFGNVETTTHKEGDWVNVPVLFDTDSCLFCGWAEKKMSKHLFLKSLLI